MLTRRQRNLIFETLVARGLDPASCELDDYKIQVDLTYEPLRTCFSISKDNRPNTYSATPVVGGVYLGDCTAASWDELMDSLGTWAEEVRYNMETPDLWAELEQVPRVLAAAQTADASNAHFTPDEQSEISRMLDATKKLVRERFELTSVQLAAIDQRLDDVEEASKRLGRKDWVMMFYGAVMSAFIADAVPPTVIQTVLTTVVHGIAHIFGFGGLPPTIGT